VLGNNSFVKLHFLYIKQYFVTQSFRFPEKYLLELFIPYQNNKNSYICQSIFIAVYLHSITNMKKEYTLDELLHKAASYCSISEHCVSEVEAKLDAWDVSLDDKSEIIEKLIAEDFINEKRFCIFFVKDKFRFNKWGKIKISYALKQKGLSNELINVALATIDDGEYEEILASILKTKLKGLKYEFEYEKQGKLFNFAQSRGFESNVINRVFRTL
jgi:regulatory protein